MKTSSVNLAYINLKSTNNQIKNKTISFKQNPDYNAKYTYTKEICKLIDEGKYGVIQAKLHLAKDYLLPGYYHIDKSSYSKDVLNIFAFLAKKYSQTKDTYFSKKDEEREILYTLAKTITTCKDFNPEEKGETDFSSNLLFYCTLKNYDEFASLLIDTGLYNKDRSTLAMVISKTETMPKSVSKLSTMLLTDRFIKEMNLAKEKSQKNSQVHKNNKNEYLERYKFIPTRYSPKSLNDVGGMNEAKKAVDEFIIKPWKDEFKQIIMENNIQMPNGFLLYGPPGCGKTYLAQALSKELNLPLYIIDLSEIGSSAAYATQNNMNKIFNELERNYNNTNKPSIVFLDELDSICANRAKIQTDWRRDEINTMLKLINNASEKGIILLGATNFLDMLDPAVLRTGRFDKKIEIKLPDESERIDIINKILKNKPLAKHILDKAPEIAKLTKGKTCSDINAIIQSAFRSAIFKKNSYLNINDIKEAIKALDFDKNKI